MNDSDDDMADERGTPAHRSRREMLAMAIAAAATVRHQSTAAQVTANIIANGRPPPATRRFRSQAVEKAIADVRGALGSSGTAGRLASLFERCFPNTLDTTVETGTIEGRPDTFVITGDIDAMWLRDSSAQIWPYLSLAAADPSLRRLVAGVVNRQTRCILIDPYANAFNKGPTGAGASSDLTAMKPELFERKWEIDSLCYPIRLAHRFWKETGDTSCFDADWRRASRLTVDTFRVMQRKSGLGPYSFRRTTDRAQDTAPNDGYGNPTRPVGLIASLFRPSDDACIFPFLVASNMFAAVSLRQLAELHQVVVGDPGFASDCRALADEIDAALRLHAVVDHPRHGRVFAYEVDGFGSRLLMDDANVPSLLSIPYLGWCKADDRVYRATRRMLLTDDNPWYFKGRVADGIGSPHTGRNRIWPISIIIRAMTSQDDAEILTSLRQLIATDAETGFMHEGFDKDDPTRYSRPWFAWANTLFGELVLKLYRERPDLLRKV